MATFLVLTLDAPLMSFGCEAIDANGPTRDFPDVSMLTGLLANALGYARGDAARHQRLQDRLSFGVRMDRPGHDLRDFHTAQLSKKDQGWTTYGEPEGRAGGEGTYGSPHIRLRHYRADAALTVALRLDPAGETPTLDDLAAALMSPARPLFFGRKACLPATPILFGVRDADNVLGALQAEETRDAEAKKCVFVLPPGVVEPLSEHQVMRLTGRRDWRVGVHVGEERMVRLTLSGHLPDGAGE